MKFVALGCQDVFYTEKHHSLPQHPLCLVTTNVIILKRSGCASRIKPLFFRVVVVLILR